VTAPAGAIHEFEKLTYQIRYVDGGRIHDALKIRSAMSQTSSHERLQSNRARRQIEVAPPTFIFMTDQQYEQAARALAAALLPMIREWHPRPARQTQEGVPPGRPPLPIAEAVSRFVSDRTAEVTPRHTNRLHTHNRERIAPGYKDVSSHHTRPDPPDPVRIWGHCGGDASKYEPRAAGRVPPGSHPEVPEAGRIVPSSDPRRAG
jgi:hypothetical protein